MLSNPCSAVAALLALTVFASPARSQCPGWSGDLELAGIAGTVNCSIVYDDGHGSALYVGGTFFGPTGLPFPRFARWKGGVWDGVGGMTNGIVESLAVFDDGSGPALYAGGFFAAIGGVPNAHIAKWNGTTWSSVGGGLVGDVTALVSGQGPSGPRLYAATDLDAGSGYIGGVREFDGTAWTTIGSSSTYGISTLGLFDAGAGPELYVGGTFTDISGVTMSNLGRWNGGAWSPVGSGTNGGVRALFVYDDGSGPALLVGGNFSTAGGVSAPNLARYDGSTFQGFPDTSGFGPVESFAVHDDGTGDALYVGSDPVGVLQPIHKRTGTGWSTLGAGIDVLAFSGSLVKALATYDDGNGPGLAVGGYFPSAAGTTASSLVLWRGGAWEDIGHEDGIRGEVHALAHFDDGSGEAVYVAGKFGLASGRSCANIARFDGSKFAPLYNGIPQTPENSIAVDVLCAVESGPAAALYAGGNFLSASNVAGTRSIARWDGASWSSLAGGISNTSGGEPVVRAMIVHDEGAGPRLFVGGRFHFAGNVHVENVARWDGSNWSALGGGLVSPTGSVVPVTALAVYDTGTGPQLYAAGSMQLPDGTWYIARWDGTSWSSVGGGLSAPYGGNIVTAMQVADLGAGPKLFVGGNFTGAAGALSAHMLAWDGAWSVPFGVIGQLSGVIALSTFDAGTGSGPALYVGGTFQGAIFGIARYDGANLTEVGDGLTAVAGYAEPARAFTTFDEGTNAAPVLYVGGNFALAGTNSANGLARWRACDLTGEAFCSGDGSATACPCGNAGAAGHGCATSNNSQGAELHGAGLASVSSDSLVLACSGTSSSTVTYFQGTQRVNAGAGAVFGDGLRCAGGVTLRLAHVLATAGASSYPGVGDKSLSVRGAIGPVGGRREYQVWFRNAASFCTPSTFNLSNGWSVVWTP